MFVSRRRFVGFSATLVAIRTLPAAASTEAAKPGDAHALLAKAVAHIKAVGADKALADFMVKPGPWFDRDLYLSVISLSGKTLAHGTNPRLVGKDNLNLQDANGKFVVKERLELVKVKPKGQQEMAVVNPATAETIVKLVFFEKIGDIVVACVVSKPA